MATAITETSPTRRRRRTQAERADLTRVCILDAAVDVLAKHGYAGLRTNDVARIAGVSRGALTHHFPSKDGLLVEVVAHVFRRAATVGRSRARGVRSVDAAIEALLADSRDFFFGELFLVALDLAIQSRSGDGRIGPLADISMASRLPVEASWIEALTALGVPVALAEDLLWLTNSIVRGLAVRRLWQDDPPRFERLFVLWREMVGNHLAVTAARQRG